MKFKLTLVALSLAATAGLTLSSRAQTSAPSSAAPAQAVAGAMTDGEVRKVDKENRKITLKHGEFKNLDMPGMTMVFGVKDAAMLENVKAGDKVLFKAEKAGGGIVVTEIQPAK